MATAPDPESLASPTASDPKQDHQSHSPAEAPDRPSPSADLPPSTAAPPVLDAGEGAAVGLEGTEGGGEAKEGEQRGEEEEEEEGECGFCLFMKGGGCKDAFVAWEQCVEDAERSGEDVVDKCFEVTSVLKKCMEAHADYYEPILQAERAMSDAIASDSSSSSSDAPAEATADKESGVDADEAKRQEKDS